MTERSHQSQSHHDDLIKQLAEYLIARKFRDIRADHPDFPQKPAPVAMGGSSAGQVPDVTAMGIQSVLFEVETDDTLYAPCTRDQWELFAAYAERHMADFWIVVPKASRDAARERVAELGLHAKVMGI